MGRAYPFLQIHREYKFIENKRLPSRHFGWGNVKPKFPERLKCPCIPVRRSPFRFLLCAFVWTCKLGQGEVAIRLFPKKRRK
jgi:hypothetical protein